MAPAFFVAQRLCGEADRLLNGRFPARVRCFRRGFCKSLTVTSEQAEGAEAGPHEPQANQERQDINDPVEGFQVDAANGPQADECCANSQREQ